jgi:hypothetical protein
MRMLILGIVGLSGLGWAVQSIGVHGSTDERAAIRHAVHAPLADLQRRDAGALCEDFTPAVAAQLVDGPSGDCKQRVNVFFERARSAGEYVAPSNRATRGALAITAIHWRGDSATAASSYRTEAVGGHAWRLEMDGLRWRIATPARLEMHADCVGHPFGAAGCVYALSLRFAGG